MFITMLFSGLWRRAVALFSAFARWVGASPLRIWVLLALLALGAALWQASRAAYWAAQARHTQAAWDAERVASVATAMAAKAAAETRYRSLADDADVQHAAALAQGDARLAAYMAAYRLRPSTGNTGRPADAGDRGAILSEGAPDDAIVAVPGIAISEADLKICDANYVYARAAHDWANGLNP